MTPRPRKAPDQDSVRTVAVLLAAFDAERQADRAAGQLTELGRGLRVDQRQLGFGDAVKLAASIAHGGAYSSLAVEVVVDQVDVGTGGCGVGTPKTAPCRHAQAVRFRDGRSRSSSTSGPSRGPSCRSCTRPVRIRNVSDVISVSRVPMSRSTPTERALVANGLPATRGEVDVVRERAQARGGLLQAGRAGRRLPGRSGTSRCGWSRARHSPQRRR